MSPSHGASSTVKEQSIASMLRQLAAPPGWLVAALQPEKVLAALGREVPEIASGSLRLVGCEPLRLFLKDTSGRWRGTYELIVEGPDGRRQAVSIRATLIAPGLPVPEEMEEASSHPFASEDWRCYLPELRLFCETEPPEQALPILPRLTDPGAARELLERTMREGLPSYRDIRIQACQPEVLNYKPGSRCTIRYALEYAQRDAGRGWPANVIVKTYRANKGRQAYEGMVALWNTSLSTGSSARIAEPLGYDAELRILVQGALDEEQTLEQLLGSSLRAGTPEAHDELMRFVRVTADGLADLHRSGARAERTVSWDERIVEIPELMERLQVVAPDLSSAIAPLLAELQAIAGAQPPDRPVPSHGSFDGDQVVISRDSIGFIDFDSFCMAEPALDVGHFRASVMDSGMKLIDDRTLHDPQACQAYLRRLDEICDDFLVRYESRASISRRRLALWEALDYFRDAIHNWTKPKPTAPEGVVRILEYHLRGMGLLA